MAFTVGYDSGTAWDSSRTAWRCTTERPVAWSAWYPAATAAAQVRDIFDGSNSAFFRSPLVASDAALNGEKSVWPVVIISHGTGGSAQSLCWLGHALASGGFIAIAVSHHGNTSVEPPRPEAFLCWWERATDLSLILDHLGSTGRFAGRFDSTRICAAGFSLGSHTVLSLAGAVTHLPQFDEWLRSAGHLANGPREFPDLGKKLARLTAESKQFRQSLARSGENYRDGRIKAAVLLAPAPPVRALKPDSLSAIKVPVHIIASSGDVEAPLKEGAFWLCEQNAAFSLTQLPDAVGHYVFLPEATPFGRQAAPDICIDAAGVERTAIHSFVAKECLEVFKSAIG